MLPALRSRPQHLGRSHDRASRWPLSRRHVATFSRRSRRLGLQKQDKPSDPAESSRVIAQSERPSESSSSSHDKSPRPKRSVGAQAAPTLLEQLFPEDAKRRNEQGRKGPEREIPRLKLDVATSVGWPHRPAEPGPERGAEPGARSAEPLDRWPPTGQHPRSKEAPSPAKQALYADTASRPEETTVLFLRSASKNLVEEDFRRVIPKGKHLEGWDLDEGDIVKVIPGRDSTTLERLSYYFLLFKSPLSAFAYQGHVTRLHKMSMALTPSTAASPLFPSGMLLEGENVHESLETYALIPPSQVLSLTLLTPPLAPNIATLVRHQGYPNVVLRPDKSPAEVLFRLEGAQLALNHIKSAILRAERVRGWQWTGDSMGSMPITKWEVEGEAASVFSRRKLPNAYADTAKTSEDRGELPQTLPPNMQFLPQDGAPWRTPADTPNDSGDTPGPSIEEGRASREMQRADDTFQPYVHGTSASRDVRQEDDTFKPFAAATSTSRDMGKEDKTLKPFAAATSASRDMGEDSASPYADMARRTPVPRYICGFATEAEAQTFVRYWHRRTMEPYADFDYENGDIPPVVIAEILW